jgi:N-methylhydantoinase A
MRQAMLAQLAGEGFAAETVRFRSTVDMRFRGQASEIRIAYPAPGHPTLSPLAALISVFADEHERLYGHRSDPDNPVEVVAVRLVGRAGAQEKDSLEWSGALKVAGQQSGQDTNMATSRAAHFGTTYGLIETPVITRSALQTTTRGPLLIDEYDSTIVVPPDMQASLDAQGNVVVVGD